MIALRIGGIDDGSLLVRGRQNSAELPPQWATRRVDTPLDAHLEIGFNVCSAAF